MAKFSAYMRGEKGSQGLVGPPASNITATVEYLSSTQTPIASVSSSTEVDNTKSFNIHFQLPTAPTSAGYKQISFSTSDGTGYTWSDKILRISRNVSNQYNSIIPINIYKKINNEYKAIAADFKITEQYIEYNADEKFEGYIHCMKP